MKSISFYDKLLRTEGIASKVSSLMAEEARMGYSRTSQYKSVSSASYPHTLSDKEPKAGSLNLSKKY